MWIIISGMRLKKAGIRDNGCPPSIKIVGFQKITD